MNGSTIAVNNNAETIVLTPKNRNTDYDGVITPNANTIPTNTASSTDMLVKSNSINGLKFITRY